MKNHSSLHSLGFITIQCGKRIHLGLCKYHVCIPDHKRVLGMDFGILRVLRVFRWSGCSVISNHFGNTISLLNHNNTKSLTKKKKIIFW